MPALIPGTLAAISADGKDAGAFLHGQFCGDLLALPDGGARLTAWCSAKGRVLTTVFACRRGARWTLIVPASLAMRVLQRLRLFVLRADAVLQSAPDDTAVVVLDEDAAHALSPQSMALCWPLPDAAHGAGRYLAVMPAAALHAAGVTAPLRDTAARDVFDTENARRGMPWIEATTSELFLPQELGLEAWEGLSYTKGCYPGQEVVARLHYRGAVKRGPYRLTAPPGEPAPAPGTRLLDAGGNPVATVLYGGATVATDRPLLAVVDHAEPPYTVLYAAPGGPPWPVVERLT